MGYTDKQRVDLDELLAEFNTEMWKDTKHQLNIAIPMDVNMNHLTIEDDLVMFKSTASDTKRREIK
jgi:hypothetical protein